MNKVCFIIPFFGVKFPNGFDYFMKSASLNKGIDFLFFTNILYQHDHFHNIKFIPFEINDFNSLASSKLKEDIHISRAYKLCDFKPAYGIIFQDYLKEYDYWGYCDIDVVFGNINHFLEPLINENYELISARKEFLSGFFTVYKNIPKCNLLFMRSKDWRLVLTSEDNFCFDECNYFFSELFSGKDILDLDTVIESMTEVIKKHDDIKVHMKTICHEHLYHTEFNDDLILENGCLKNVETNKTYLAVHFIKLKKLKLFHFAPINFESDKIYIDIHGVSNYKKIQNKRYDDLLNLRLKLKDHLYIQKDGSGNLYLKSNKSLKLHFSLSGWNEFYLFFHKDFQTGLKLFTQLKLNDSLSHISDSILKHNISILLSNGAMGYDFFEIEEISLYYDNINKEALKYINSPKIKHLLK